MGTAPVTEIGTVVLKGIHFQESEIREMMVITGGIPVSDENINLALDGIMREKTAQGKSVEALVIEDIPDHWFIPFKFNIRTPGVPIGGWLYFAVKRNFKINA